MHLHALAVHETDVFLCRAVHEFLRLSGQGERLFAIDLIPNCVGALRAPCDVAAGASRVWLVAATARDSLADP